MGDKRKGAAFNRRPILKEDRHVMKNEVTGLHEELVETLQELQAAHKEVANFKKAWEAEKRVSAAFLAEANRFKNTRRHTNIASFVAGVVVGVGVIILWLIS